MRVGCLGLEQCGKGPAEADRGGLMDVGEETSLRAAIPIMCGRSIVNGRRHDSAERFGR